MGCFCDVEWMLYDSDRLFSRSSLSYERHRADEVDIYNYNVEIVLFDIFEEYIDCDAIRTTIALNLA